MSMITENTIVIRSTDVEKLFDAFNYQAEEYGWINNPVEVFKNAEIAIFVFDCNGQPLGVDENISFLLLETNYLDGEPYYTQVFNKELGYIVETEMTALEYIRELISEEEYEKIKDSIRYSEEIISFEELFQKSETIKDEKENSNPPEKKKVNKKDDKVL